MTNKEAAIILEKVQKSYDLLRQSEVALGYYADETCMARKIWVELDDLAIALGLDPDLNIGSTK